MSEYELLYFGGCISVIVIGGAIVSMTNNNLQNRGDGDQGLVYKVQSMLGYDLGERQAMEKPKLSHSESSSKSSGITSSSRKSLYDESTISQSSSSRITSSSRKSLSEESTTISTDDIDIISLSSASSFTSCATDLSLPESKSEVEPAVTHEIVLKVEQRVVQTETKVDNAITKIDQLSNESQENEKKRQKDDLKAKNDIKKYVDDEIKKQAEKTDEKIAENKRDADGKIAGLTSRQNDTSNKLAQFMISVNQRFNRQDKIMFCVCAFIFILALWLSI